VPPEKAGGTARWRLSIAAVQQILSSVGFTQQCLTFHSPMCGRTAVPYYTVVAGRAAKPGTAFAVSASRESPAALVERPAAPPPPPPPAPAPARIDHAPLASKLPPLASDDALDRVDDTLPLPSARGRFLVAGTDDVEVFVTLGRAGFKALIAALQRAGVDIGGLGRVLDFGCGVGRVLRYWHGVPGVAIHGTDLNAEAIAWGQDNLRFASLTTNTLEPRLDYPNGHFGFVYALSVFTHLPEAMQRPFLTELLRVIRPGGHLYFTTHGVSYRTMLTPEMRDGFDRDELVVGGADDPGSNYCGAFHPTAYVRAQMLDPCGATLVEFLPEGALGNPTQDSWLIRKPF
jgi:SAM-dependent methyltransferase